MKVQLFVGVVEFLPCRFRGCESPTVYYWRAEMGLEVDYWLVSPLRVRMEIVGLDGLHLV